MNDPVLLFGAPIDTLNISVPVLAGAPGQALDVHTVAVWATPLMLVQVTGVPAATVADSGLRQYVLPPPLQAPVVMVITVLAAADTGTAEPAVATSNAPAADALTAATPPQRDHDERIRIMSSSLKD